MSLFSHLPAPKKVRAGQGAGEDHPAAVLNPTRLGAAAIRQQLAKAQQQRTRRDGSDSAPAAQLAGRPEWEADLEDVSEGEGDQPSASTAQRSTSQHQQRTGQGSRQQLRGQNDDDDDDAEDMQEDSGDDGQMLATLGSASSDLRRRPQNTDVAPSDLRRRPRDTEGLGADEQGRDDGRSNDGAAGSDLKRRRREPETSESSSDAEDGDVGEGGEEEDVMEGAEAEEEEAYRRAQAAGRDMGKRAIDAPNAASLEGPRRRARERDDQAGSTGNRNGVEADDASTAGRVRKATGGGASGVGGGCAPAAVDMKSLAQDQQVSAALAKIASHISGAGKFLKASGLLRQLLDGAALHRGHRSELLAAARAAFYADMARPTDPHLRREYMRLATALDKRTDVWGRAERPEVDTFFLLGRTQNELATDDSFLFNKVLMRLKTLITELPEATPLDDLIHTYQDVPVNASDTVTAVSATALAAATTSLASASAAKGGKQKTVLTAESALAEAVRLTEAEEAAAQVVAEASRRPAAVAKVEAEVEADPFNLDTLLASDVQAAPAPTTTTATATTPTAVDLSQREAVGTAAGADDDLERKVEKGGRGDRLSDGVSAAVVKGGAKRRAAAEALGRRRQALLVCVHAARAQHRHAWAATGVELLIEHFMEHAASFTPQQRRQLDEHMAWVRAQRAMRKQGPTAREVKRDTTAFERDRADWGRAKLSARGKVGAGGDTKSFGWLG